MCFNIDFTGNLQHIHTSLNVQLFCFLISVQFMACTDTVVTIFLVKKIDLMSSTEQSEFMNPVNPGYDLLSYQGSNPHPHRVLPCLCFRYVCVSCISAETKCQILNGSPLMAISLFVIVDTSNTNPIFTRHLKQPMLVT